MPRGVARYNGINPFDGKRGRFTMRTKRSARQAWALLFLSLPKGIAAFITAVTGLAVSLPLSVFLVGLPLLAETLVLCGHLLELEKWSVERWKRGRTADAAAGSRPVKPGWEGWQALLARLFKGRSYRGILYGFLQLPVGITACTLAIVLPVTFWAVQLSPAAYWISVRYFSFDWYADGGLVVTRLLPSWSGTQLSWLYGAVGAVLSLLLPAILRGLGGLYAVWIEAAAGPAAPAATSPAPRGSAAPAADPIPEMRQYA